MSNRSIYYDRWFLTVIFFDFYLLLLSFSLIFNK